MANKSINDSNYRDVWLLAIVRQTKGSVPSLPWRKKVPTCHGDKDKQSGAKQQEKNSGDQKLQSNQARL
jgi:hypothetical protein